MKRKVFIVKPSVCIVCHTVMLAFALRNNTYWNESRASNYCCHISCGLCM